MTAPPFPITPPAFEAGQRILNMISPEDEEESFGGGGGGADGGGR